jgi:F0F1-type ATP synthase alpha subunit
MGEWRVQISVRVSQAVRSELEKYAAREKRTLANFGAVLLEWSFEQLKAVGSTEQLLKQNVSPGSERRK